MRITASAVAAPSSAAAAKINHLSWSSLQTYTTCPKRYRYKYIDAAPEERKAAALIFGGAFHRAAEALFQARLEGRPAPQVDVLQNIYAEAWQAEFGSAAEVIYAKTERLADLAPMAGRMLAALQGHLAEEGAHAENRHILGLEHEATFKLAKGVPEMLVRLDVLELYEIDLVVTELKTAKSPWTEQKVKEGLGKLVLYAHALVPILKEVGATRIRPRILVVTKAKRPLVQVIEPVATQADVAKLRERIVETWKGDSGGVFHPGKGDGVRRVRFGCGVQESDGEVGGDLPRQILYDNRCPCRHWKSHLPCTACFS